MERPLEHAEQEPVVAVLERAAEARVPRRAPVHGRRELSRSGLDLALQQLNKKNTHRDNRPRVTPLLHRTGFFHCFTRGKVVRDAIESNWTASVTRRTTSGSPRRLAGH